MAPLLALLLACTQAEPPPPAGPDFSRFAVDLLIVDEADAVQRWLALPDGVKANQGRIRELTVGQEITLPLVVRDYPPEVEPLRFDVDLTVLVPTGNAWLEADHLYGEASRLDDGTLLLGPVLTATPTALDPHGTYLVQASVRDGTSGKVKHVRETFRLR